MKITTFKGWSYFVLSTLMALISNAQDTLEVYQPDISRRWQNVRDVAIHPTLDMEVLTVQSVKHEFSFLVLINRVQGESLYTHRVAPFSGHYPDLEPFFTPDGKWLYFVSKRPKNASDTTELDADIWRVPVEGNGIFGEPEILGASINTEAFEYYPSLTSSGTLFFTTDRLGGEGNEDIYYSELKDGVYQTPVCLDSNVNSKLYEFNAFVAPDESYLIFTSYGRKEGLGGGDLYISFKDEKGWSKAQHMGEPVNSKGLDYCPFVCPKTNRFYWTSNRSRVQTHYAEDLRYDELFKKLWQVQNGRSRIYALSSIFVTSKLK